MSREALFVEAVKRDYEREGWKVLAREQIDQEIGFIPDLVLERGNDHLVIDVKEAGYSESRALKVIRKLIEAREGWRFEVKVIPPSWRSDGGDHIPDDVRQRIGLSQQLASTGYQKEAFILGWTSLEALLRDRVPANEKRLLPLTDLIRQAYENGIIGVGQLPLFHRMLSLRNHLVHGVSADMSRDDMDKLLELIASVSSVPQAARHTKSP